MERLEDVPMSNPAHVRIDEGVKRGPRKLGRGYRGSIKKRDPETGQVMRVMPTDLVPATVIERYLSDERTADIAASYGVARSRLNQWLIENAEDVWRKAQVARAVTSLETAKDQLGAAEDPLTLARAREQLRGAQWELERLYSRLFGVKQEITHSVSVTVESEVLSEFNSLLSHYIGASQPIEHNHPFSVHAVDAVADNQQSLPPQAQADPPPSFPDPTPGPPQRGYPEEDLSAGEK
jgi:hypothetical protein